MRGIGSWFVNAELVCLSLLTLVLLGGCNAQTSEGSKVDIKLYQQWELQSGDTIAGYKVMGGLGDISIALNGNAVYAPFAGEAKVDAQGCVYFSTPEIPAYQFRFCGLTAPKLGQLASGATIGRGQILQFAALRKQPTGTWAIVEPSKNILERTLKSP